LLSSRVKGSEAAMRMTWRFDGASEVGLQEALRNGLDFRTEAW
jgi:hypothetical protein